MVVFDKFNNGNEKGNLGAKKKLVASKVLVTLWKLDNHRGFELLACLDLDIQEALQYVCLLYFRVLAWYSRLNETNLYFAWHKLKKMTIERSITIAFRFLLHFITVGLSLNFIRSATLKFDHTAKTLMYLFESKPFYLQ